MKRRALEEGVYGAKVSPWWKDERERAHAYLKLLWNAVVVADTGGGINASVEVNVR